jgi:LuxR family transcriptional regulator
MTRAKANGLRFGATVAVGKVFAKSIGAIANADREVSDEEIAEFSGLVSDIHEIIGHRKPLLDTHLRALELFSFGYSYDEMCTILSISRTALKSRLSGARRRLGAGSNVEAVRIAAERNLLRPHSLSGPSS